MRRAIVLCLLVLLVGPAILRAGQAPPGFTHYYIGFMTRGTGALPPGTTAEEIQKGHLAHLSRLYEEGLLVGAGPIIDKGDLRGLVIMADRPRAMLEARIADDPAVKSGRLRVELRRWMGPAGIGDGYKKWAAANPGAADRMKTYQIAFLKPGPRATGMSPEAAARIHSAHLANMSSMAKNGALIAAGPVVDPGDIAGLYVFAVGADDAAALAASDPAVTAGRFIVEQHPWLVAEGVLPTSFTPPQVP